MQIKLEDIGREARKVHQELPKSDFQELALLEAVKVGLDLRRSGEKVSALGEVQTALGLECSRCAENFRYKIDADIDIVYKPAVSIDALEPKEEKIREEDFRYATYEGHILELDKEIKEAIQLSIPIKPLCGEECQGLCPRCGQNLNLKNCECVKRSLDPRLSGLGELLKKTKKNRS